MARHQLVPDLDAAHRLSDGRWRWNRSLVLEGATFLKLHFRYLRLRPGDQLLLRSIRGTVETLTTDGPKDGEPFWSLAVLGEGAELELSFRRPYAEPPFEIDRVALGGLPAGSPPLGVVPNESPASRAPGMDPGGPGSTKSLCGPGDFEDVACYQADAEKWANISATAGIITVEADQVFWCTGVA
ncbi:MAG: hypothetical protein MI919_02840, partial [Holophagales bacterium]|nr:hypothetical protein [Holophagales bacterium]